MRLTSSRIHDGHNFLPQGAVIEVNNDGVIVAISDELTPDVQFYEGILTPGFVNAHCHLELSHLESKIPEGTGLIPFLKEIPALRMQFSDREKNVARKAAYNQLIENGVVAVGDISNTADMLQLRAEEKLHMHTFVECLGFNDDRAVECFAGAVETFSAYEQQLGQKAMLRQSVTPHAPYSVSPGLFSLIDEHQPGSLLSVHNQESEEENRFFRTGAGELNDLLGSLGIDHAHFRPSGKSSLKTYQEWLAPGHPVLLVHNTYSKQEDVIAAHHHFFDVYWYLCPNANLYIEGKLPDVQMLIASGAKICIGTDSLASNHQLSIYAELQTLKEHFPSLEWEILLHWGTLAGAKALAMDNRIGSIEVGKQPGIVQVLDHKVKRIT